MRLTDLRIPLLLASYLAGIAAPAAADDLAVLLGHTWTRAELLAPPQPGSPLRLQTGHCFTITVPYAHRTRGAWGWSTAITMFHPDYDGRAVPTVEIPLSVRWTGTTGAVQPYVEAGPALSWGAGMSTGHEHTVEWSASLDACAGITAPLGDEHVTLAVRTVNRPQDGMWARRVALQAGVTPRVLGAGARGPDGEPLRPPRLGRDGSLFEGGGLRAGRLEFTALTGGITRGHEVTGFSYGGHAVRSTSSRFSGAAGGATLSYGGEMALRISALYVTEHATYDHVVDGVQVASSRASCSAITVPVQFQLSPFTGAVRPYMAIGPAMTFRRTREARLSDEELFASVTGTAPCCPNPRNGVRVSLGALLHPTAGVEARVGGLHLRAEARAIASPLDDRATSFVYLAGIRLAP